MHITDLNFNNNEKINIIENAGSVLNLQNMKGEEQYYKK